MRITHNWTEEERNIVRRDYRGTYQSVKNLAVQIGVSEQAIRCQAVYLGVTRPGRRWGTRDEQFLRDNIQSESLNYIAKALRRTRASVRNKARRLGVSSCYRDGWYNIQDACQILGVDRRKVVSWISSGALRASGHNGQKPKWGGDTDRWHITDDDLREFITTHSSELLGRNVDIQQIVWLLTDFV